MLFTLAFLATARITRFFSDDILAAPIRRWWKNHAPGRITKQLITCPWCLSIWLSITVPAAYLVSPGQHWEDHRVVFVIPAVMLAASYFTGIVANIIDTVNALSNKLETEETLLGLQAEELSQRVELARLTAQRQD